MYRKSFKNRDFGIPLENTEFKETRAPSRPKRLDAKVVRFQNNKEKVFES